MRATRNRIIFWSGLGALLALALAYAFWPRAVPVDLAEISHGPMLVTISEEGETRVKDVHVVLAPVSGTMRRVEVEPGDAVMAGETVLASIEPGVSPIIDTRTEAQLSAAIEAAEAGVAEAESEVARADADLVFAEAELARARPLAASGTMARQRFEQIEAAAESARAVKRAADSSLRARRFELTAAEAALMPASSAAAGCECFDVVADLDGVVLRVARESGGPVAQGETLIEIGDQNSLELVVDLLSEDAVAVSPGDEVIISGWGGAPLAGRVRVVEPFAFTKVSALGIEEQRVNVVIDFADLAAATGRLGHGYRADVDVVVWRSDGALQAPMTAVFRDGGSWAVYVESGGRARLRRLELGRLNGTEAEVLAGVEAGDRVVEYPSDRISNGSPITRRDPA